MSVYRTSSGKWKAEVYHPSGRRVTKVKDTERAAQLWEAEQLVAFARGDTRDPRAGNITVGAWYERWHAVSGGEPSTRKRTESFWSTRIEARWSSWPMAAITRLDAKGWVGELKAEVSPFTGRPLSADTVHKLVLVMSALYAAALEESPPLVVSNPFARLGKKVLPTIPPSPIFWYEDEEIDAILDAIPRLSDRVLVEVGFWVGLRPGELFGLFGDRVNWMRSTVEVTRVETREEGLREYPKTEKSHRTVPVPPNPMKGLCEVIAGRDLRGRVFLSPDGDPIDDSNFLKRVWNPAIRRAGVRPYNPRAMRHTAATRLVMAGVDLYRVQDLLGHEKYATTQRYAHLKPQAHDAIRDAWERRPQGRTG